MRRFVAWTVPVAALALIAAGCASGDSADRAESTGTGTVTETTEAAAGADNPLIVEAVDQYHAYAVEQTEELVRVTRTFTDAVRAGDLPAAQAAYAPSRQPWERIEPLAALVEQIDVLIDARVDDFAGIDDPAFSGWHRLEHLLFEQNTTEGGMPFADQLDRDVARLRDEMASLEIAPVDVPVGAAELIEEVSEGKVTGEENRYAKTDLWDFEANLQGSRVAIDTLSPALAEADPALLGRINDGFDEIFETMQPLRRGDGWVLYCTEDDPYPSPRCPEVTVPRQTVDTLKAQLAGLSEEVSQVAGVLGLK